MLAFEPHGADIQLTYYLLMVQFIDMAIKIFDIYKHREHIQKGQSVLDLVRILYGLFSIPFIAIAYFLYIRFKLAFSRQTSRNMIKLSWVMISENCLNFILRFFVEVKTMDFSYRNLSQFLVPVLFFVCWVGICYISTKKQGDYDAPPGLLYLQSRDFIEKNSEQMTQADLE